AGDAVANEFGGGRGPGGPRNGGNAPVGAAAGPIDQVAAQAAEEGLPPFGRGASTSYSVAEVTPLVVAGIMYVTSPYGRVTALHPKTGTEIWNYKLPTGQPATRGVEYFPGDSQTPPQIVVTTADAKLFTLDAKSGALNLSFGVNGIVDLNTPEITHNLARA